MASGCVKATVDGRDICKGLTARSGGGQARPQRSLFRAAATTRAWAWRRLHHPRSRSLVRLHIAQDFDKEPMWRQKPLTGDEATIRENARYNSRFAGVKLPERANSPHAGNTASGSGATSSSNDSLRSVSGIRGQELPPLVDASTDFEEEPDIASTDLHGGGIPGDGGCPGETPPKLEQSPTRISTRRKPQRSKAKSSRPTPSAEGRSLSRSSRPNAGSA